MKAFWHLKICRGGRAFGFPLALAGVLASMIPAGWAADFTWKSGDVVAFVGGEDTVSRNEHGYLELFLIASASSEGATIQARNLGWEGDTVFEQQRDLNFGSWAEQLQRAQASVVFCQFGGMEALRGTEHLQEFVDAYESLLDDWGRRTSRLVLLSPTPYERVGPLLPDLAARNGDLSAYVEAVRGLAEKRGLPFVDLYHPLLAESRQGAASTRDGQHLNARGHWLVAREVARQLNLASSRMPIQFDDQSKRLTPDRLERARQIMVEKNRLWFDYWRPMNWAFLAGDRTEQPSSRDHRDPSIRWFPKEMEEFLPLIATKESDIQSLLHDQP